MNRRMGRGNGHSERGLALLSRDFGLGSLCYTAECENPASVILPGRHPLAFCEKHGAQELAIEVRYRLELAKARKPRKVATRASEDVQ